jgi:hypothetical protein
MYILIKRRRKIVAVFRSCQQQQLELGVCLEGTSEEDFFFFFCWGQELLAANEGGGDREATRRHAWIYMH